MPLVNIGSAELFYQEDDFTPPWSDKECVFLQHWIFGNHTDFFAWIPSLAREWRVVRMDRRGTGLSGRPPFGYEFTPENLIDDFARFLDCLAIESVHFVGQSLGGILGAIFAATHPDRVRTLVLCATPAKVHDRVTFARDPYTDGAAMVMQMGAWRYTYGGWLARHRPDDDPESALAELYWAEQAALVPAHVQASLMRMVLRKDVQLEPVLPEIKAPTLLLSPGASPAAPLAEQEHMRNLIPDCRQVVFDGADHMISRHMPERCAQETARFIREHSTNRG